jgi:hypothetical protein
VLAKTGEIFSGSCNNEYQKELIIFMGRWAEHGKKISDTIAYND